MTRKTTTYARKRAAGHGLRNPWMRAAAEREFQQQLTESRLHLWILQDGDDATTMLAKLSVIIGTPCEAGAHTVGRSAAWVRQLHGALRCVQAMCLAGYKWNASFAPALERAMDLAEEHQNALPVDVFTKAWIEANGMATLVLAHQVDAETVAA
jgi:hypothetical protein